MNDTPSLPPVAQAAASVLSRWNLVLLLAGLLATTGCTVLWARCHALAIHQQSLEATLAQERQHAAELQSALNGQRATLHETDADTGAPVEVTFRKAWVGPGYAAQVANRSSRSLPVRLAVTNATLQAQHTFSFVLDGSRRCELGHLEGWSFSSGDEIHLVCDASPEQVLRVP